MISIRHSAIGAVSMLALAYASSAASLVMPTTQSREPLVQAVPAPATADLPGIDWLQVEDPALGVVLFAVARPKGDGPFPAVLVLHGSHGFAREYVVLARDLSRAGVIAVAACWFGPGRGEGMQFITPVICPARTPAISPPLSETANRTVDLAARAVRSLPGVDRARLALFGHSRGGGAASHYVIRGGAPQAVILNSAGYPDDFIRHAGAFSASVLVLHGINDRPAEGGGPMTSVQRARAFEQALRMAGRPVEAVYYQGHHNSLFANRTQRDDEVRRMRAFLRRIFRIN